MPAGKPAKWRWPNPMRSEAIPESRVECTLQGDPRLIAGATAISDHVARHAGLPEHAQRELRAAVEEVYREVFPKGGARRRTEIHLSAARYADRVELAFEYPEKKRAAGAARRRGGGASGDGRTGAKLPAGQLVDRIESTRQGDRCRVTLVKYCGVARPSFRV